MRGLIARLHRRDEGNVIVITALLATTLLGFAALTIDVGALLVRRSSQQTAADAVALKIASLCADIAVAEDRACTPSEWLSPSNSYPSANFGGSWSMLRDVLPSHGGRAGRVYVRVTTRRPPHLGAAVTGGSDTAAGDRVVASASARWGPLTAIDAAFPLAVCRGVLPEVDEPFELVIDPTAPVGSGPCAGASSAQSFGWVDPDSMAACTRKITLQPSNAFNVRAADDPPTDPTCSPAITQLHDEIDAGTAPQRNVIVYDAGTGTAGAKPAYAIATIEFTKARFAGRVSQTDPAVPWTAPICDDTVAWAIDEVQCLAGTVRLTVTPTDGPIYDPALAALPGIDDTTVLDVRLVE